MLEILLEVLNRLREVPGLGFLRRTYEDLKIKRDKVNSIARKVTTQKKYAESSLARVRDVPSIVKGSKKRT